MKASIAGGVIHSTDYFSSRDRDEGRAWLSQSPCLLLSQSPSLQVFFKPWPGVQIHATLPLWLVRDTRKGEKPLDLQRRLKRFREQRPGGL